MNKIWGFLRETSEDANKAGIDENTGLPRTGLNEYLDVIFPNVKDWVHDKPLGKINGKTYKIRPDYKSEKLKLIVEFDGAPHYQKPHVIQKDKYNTKIYESLGYKVVRIPYFIQLSKSAVKIFFNVDIKEDLFDENIPSLGENNKLNPGYLCPLGLKRMSQEFIKFPKQYEVNINSLKNSSDVEINGVDFLEYFYNKTKNKK